MEYLHILASLITGGLAGAVANIFVTRRRQRTEAALRYIDDFFRRYRSIADVKSILQDPPSLADRTKQNAVLEMGDWFNMVAALCENDLVDTYLLGRVALFGEMEKFCILVDGTFNTSEVLNRARDWWRHLYKLDLKSLKG